MGQRARGFWRLPGTLATTCLLAMGCGAQVTTFGDGAPPGGGGTCQDGIKNQDESDVDCGGALCERCLEGKACQSDVDCKSTACAGGLCQICKPQAAGCLGNLVRTCGADGASWTTVATCDPAKAEACDPATRSCKVLAVTGSPTATGTYYLYTMFTSTQGFKGGYDVDSYVASVGDSGENLIYVNRQSQLDVYKVELVDTDGDGKLEPNQHPENPDAKGPIEARKLTFVKTYSNVTLGSPSVGELYAAKDRIYFQKKNPTSSGADIFEFVMAAGTTNLVVPAHPKAAMCLLGFDETTKRWFASNDGKVDSVTRRVYSYNPDGGGWAAEFVWPNLAGGHGDGMEVVLDVKSKIPYIYVSDMTSDFIAQYYQDSSGKWIQKNVFKYMETAKQSVEGMGFGAFQHFWITSGTSLYEVGGGDLQQFIGPD